VRIEVQTSGGFAGITRPPEVVETSELDSDEASALEALARRVAAEPAAGTLPGPRGPDRFQYDLTIDGRHVRLHEDRLSDAARELIARVQDLRRGT
jgi:hypothetical protein